MSLKFIGPDFPAPERLDGGRDYVLGVIEQLKTRPDEWAVVESYEDDPAKAHRRREAILRHSGKLLEVRVLKPDVLAKYVGPTTASRKEA